MNFEFTQLDQNMAMIHEYFQALLHAGFTEDQALEIVKQIVDTAMRLSAE